MKRKIELFMVLFLLIGAIVASWKLSEMTANVSKETKDKKAKTVIVVDPGHGGSKLRQNLKEKGAGISPNKIKFYYKYKMFD